MSQLCWKNYACQSCWIGSKNRDETYRSNAGLDFQSDSVNVGLALDGWMIAPDRAPSSVPIAAFTIMVLIPFLVKHSERALRPPLCPGSQSRVAVASERWPHKAAPTHERWRLRPSNGTTLKDRSSTHKGLGMSDPMVPSHAR